MKKIKYLLYFVVSICLIVFIASNKVFLSTIQAFDINLYQPLYQWPTDLKLQKISFHLPAVANGLSLLGCFIFGFLLANFRNLVKRFKNTKQIKQLESKNKSLTIKIEDLQKEVDFLQRNASKPAAAPINRDVNVGQEAVATEEETELSQ